VTSEPEEAARCVDEGSPVVLVGDDAEELGRLTRTSSDEGARERFLGVMVGDPGDPQVRAAAEEMAAELWQWARDDGPSSTSA
jgi:hypothetical protein